MLLPILVLLMASCATVKIPNVRLYAEIPFMDGAEGVYVETTSKRQGTISAVDWEEMRPYMLMLSIDDWAEIKKQWLIACKSYQNKCNVAIKSVDSAIKRLDNLLKIMDQ